MDKPPKDMLMYRYKLSFINKLEQHRFYTRPKEGGGAHQHTLEVTLTETCYKKKVADDSYPVQS